MPLLIPISAGLSGAGAPPTGGFSLVQSFVSAMAGGTPVSQVLLPVPADVSVDNLLIVAAVSNNTAGPFTCADDGSNAYTPDEDYTDTVGGNLRLAVFSAPVTTGLSLGTGDVITVTFAGTPTHYGAIAMEWGGHVPGYTCDRHSAAEGSSTAPSVGPLAATTTQLVLGVCGYRSGTGFPFVPGSGWTGLGVAYDDGTRAVAVEYRQVSGSVTPTADGTLPGSTQWVQEIVCYSGS